MIRLILFNLLLLPVLFTNAQDDKELDPITVTATLTPISASKTGRNISDYKR